MGVICGGGGGGGEGGYDHIIIWFANSTPK